MTAVQDFVPIPFHYGYTQTMRQVIRGMAYRWRELTSEDAEPPTGSLVITDGGHVLWAREPSGLWSPLIWLDRKRPRRRRWRVASPPLGSRDAWLIYQPKKERAADSPAARS